MMGNDLDRVLADSAEEVLETMFFATLMGDAPGPGPQPGPAARVTFRGDPCGAVTVSACPEAARSLAAAFLALDDAEVSGEHAAEVVSEMANMICGSILGRLHPDSIFELLHPEPVDAGSPVPGAAASRFFDIGAGTVSVSLELAS